MAKPTRKSVLTVFAVVAGLACLALWFASGQRSLAPEKADARDTARTPALDPSASPLERTTIDGERIERTSAVDSRSPERRATTAHVVQVQVVDAVGSPVADASIAITRHLRACGTVAPTTSRTVSDIDGRARLSVAGPGVVWIEARKDGGVTRRRALLDSTRHETALRIELRSEAGVADAGFVVLVLDEQLRPKSGANVSIRCDADDGASFAIRDDATHEGTTDADGRFAVPQSTPRAMHVLATSGSLAGAVVRGLLYGAPDERIAVVALRPSFTVTAELRGAASWMRDLAVRAVREPNLDGARAPSIEVATAPAQAGTFRLTGLPAGNYRFEVGSGQRWFPTEVLSTDRNGGERRSVALDLDGDATTTARAVTLAVADVAERLVTVVDVDRLPVADARVGVTTSDDAHAEIARTDASGSVRVAAPTSQPLRVRAEKDGRSGRVTCGVGHAGPIVVVIAARGSLQVWMPRWFDHASLRSPDGEVVADDAVRGFVQFDDLAAGTHTLVLSDRSPRREKLRDRTVPVAIEAGQMRFLDLREDTERFELVGRVVRDGVGVGGVRVHWEQGAAESEPNGHFVVRGNGRPGATNAVVVRVHDGDTVRKFEIGARVRDRLVDVGDLDCTGRARLVVTMRGGQGTAVTLSGGHHVAGPVSRSSFGHARVDDGGRCEFRALAAGNYVVRLADVRGGELAQVAVRLRDGETTTVAGPDRNRLRIVRIEVVDPDGRPWGNVRVDCVEAREAPVAEGDFDAWSAVSARAWPVVTDARGHASVSFADDARLAAIVWPIPNFGGVPSLTLRSQVVASSASDSMRLTATVIATR